MSIPQGVWSLKDAMARRDLYEQQKTRPKRKTVIEIDDGSDTPETSNTEPSIKPPKTKKPSKTKPEGQGKSENAENGKGENSNIAEPTNHSAKTRKAPKPKAEVKSENVENGKSENSDSNNTGPTNHSIESQELIKTQTKTRRPPKKKREIEADEYDSDDYTTKMLERETPASRKSPRIRDRVILLDSSDSEPELLPVTARQPLRARNNTNVAVNKASYNATPLKPANKRAKKQTVAVTKSGASPTESVVSVKSTRSASTRNASTRGASRMNSAVSEASSSTNPVRSAAESVKERSQQRKAPSEKTTSPNTDKRVRAEESSKVAVGLPEKRPRRSPPQSSATSNKSASKAPAEVIRIPDSLASGKRKQNITSKVVKIKKPAAPKKNQGPTKAGSVPPLALKTVITNTTQKTTYTLDTVLGSGGFGYIYTVTEAGSNRKAVMKVEPQDNGPLFSEMHFYQRAGKQEQLAAWVKKHKLKYLGVPNMYGFGIHLQSGTKFRYLVMPLFDGGDLVKLHASLNKKFSVQSSILLCIRMVEALHYIHEAGYVHADIKSANILVKNGRKEVFLADFGLARKYTMDGTHKTYKEEPAKAHDGTKEFTSIDAHKGVQPARRGDLHILSYCMIDWLGGKLPWYTWDNCNNIRSEKIKHEKRSEELLEQSIGLANLSSRPWQAIKTYLLYAFSLDYEERPRYDEIVKKLKEGLTKPDSGYMVWS